MEWLRGYLRVWLFFLCLVLCIRGHLTTPDLPPDLTATLTKAIRQMDIKDKLARTLHGPARFLYDRIRPVLKLLGVVYAGYHAYDYVLPSFVDFYDDPEQAKSTKKSSPSIQEAIGELGISALAEGVSSWAEVAPDSRQILGHWQQQCRSRAACELGKSLARTMPYLSKIIGYFGSRLPLIHNFADALMQGTSLPDCSALYPECPYIRSTPIQDSNST